MMTGKLKFIFLIPFFMAIDCEDDFVCSYEEPQMYMIDVENVAEAYSIGETIWLNSEISSVLLNECTNEEEMVTDSQLFRDGLFLLELTNELTELNARIFQDYNVTVSKGESFNFDVCSNAIAFLPELSEDNMTFEYRFGISINEPGVYCLVNAYNNIFMPELENNAEIFDAYNTLNNRIRFESCQDIYTRLGTDGFYFFWVN